MSQDNHIVYPDAEEHLSSVFIGERLARLENLGKFSVYYGERPSTATCIERIVNIYAVYLCCYTTTASGSSTSYVSPAVNV